MKLNSNKRTSNACFTFDQAMRSIILSALLLTAMYAPLHAQDAKYTVPSWWFGVAAGPNVNFFNGSTQHLTADFITPVPFHSGIGVGLYAAPLIEYHSPNSRWGVMLQAGYDGRNGSFKQVYSPCNCPRDLSTDLGYVTIEPSLRFAPMKQGLYIYIGPRLAFNVMKSFTFTEKPNPEFPNQTVDPAVNGKLSDVKEVLVSMQVGVGYDIVLSHRQKPTQVMLSPFVSFQPYIGQSPRTIETWTVTTLRAGLALKFGRGRKMPEQAIRAVAPTQVVAAAVVIAPHATLIVNSPANIPTEHRVRETFPLRNYIFFDKGATEISSRYVLLRKDQVNDFSEENLEVRIPKNLAGRNVRQMVVYYNILNIVGDRMQKNPSADITLVGASDMNTANGEADGRNMAESVKRYLVSVWGIDPSRITTVGRNMPKKPSEKPEYGATDLALLQEEDRRVYIGSNSASMLMEFKSGPSAPLKPVEMNTVLEAPLDSYVSFDVKGDSNDMIAPWSLVITDESGAVQNFGPYSVEKVSLPGKSILGTRAQGNFKVTMTGLNSNGKTVTRDTTIHMVLWTPPVNDMGRRYSVIFEFDDSKVIGLYDKYLTEVVAPKIPLNATVIIHGHTDIIGDEAHNQKLSNDRASDVRSILSSALSNSGRTDVKFEVRGFGADINAAPFENKFPEERFYNRTVIIDIIPAK
jgi:outer membrane protein OmpA-like peptidoglycan-associated protein